VKRILLSIAAIVPILALAGFAFGLWTASNQALAPSWRGVEKDLSICKQETEAAWGARCGNLRETHQFAFSEIQIPRPSQSVTLGGTTDDLHGPPVTVSGVVRLIADGRFEEPEPVHGGFRYFNNGTSVVLQTDDGHTLLLVSTRYLNTSRQQYYTVGVRPEDFRIIVAKGVVSPRPAYQPIAAEMLLVNTGGASSADLTTFDYRRRRRPLYPFELDATYP